MQVHDSLGNRMKEYESRNQYYLQKRTPVAIRVDMRAGHTFTKGFDRPFDKVFMDSMQATAFYMCQNIQNAKLSFVQSDEITVILTDYDTLTTAAWFEYRTDKLCSIAASMATLAFNNFFATNVRLWESTLDQKEPSEDERVLSRTYRCAMNKGAMFDARCFNIPKEEVCNLIYWRQLDATHNSIQMVGQANFSHKELQNKTCNDIQDMLMTQKGINWNDMPVECKRGVACIKNDAGEWFIDKNMPILKGEARNYIESHIMLNTATWMLHNADNPFIIYSSCSNCGFEQSLSNKLNYCPNCGSVMSHE